MSETQKQQYIIRVEGFANSYGLGTEVAPGCTLFKAGDYHLTKEQLSQRIFKGTLTRDFKETVKARADRDPEFKGALRKERL